MKAQNGAIGGLSFGQAALLQPELDQAPDGPGARCSVILGPRVDFLNERIGQTSAVHLIVASSRPPALFLFSRY